MVPTGEGSPRHDGSRIGGAPPGPVAFGAMTDPAPVTVRPEGDVSVITIDDGKANALTFGVIEAVSSALADAGRDARAAVVVGRPGRFSAGFDLKVMTGDVAEARELLGRGAELGIQIFSSPVPVVLGITGHALAMGGILSTCADHRVGARGDYKLGLNEVAIGMPVPVFGVELCRDRLAPRWFTRCVQHAHLCTPEEAVDAGFLDELTELDAVADRALEVASHLAATVYPGPFRLTRTNCRGELAARLAASLAADLALFDVAGG